MGAFTLQICTPGEQRVPAFSDGDTARVCGCRGFQAHPSYRGTV